MVGSEIDVMAMCSKAIGLVSRRPLHEGRSPDSRRRCPAADGSTAWIGHFLALRAVRTANFPDVPRGLRGLASDRRTYQACKLVMVHRRGLASLLPKMAMATSVKQEQQRQSHLRVFDART